MDLFVHAAVLEDRLKAQQSKSATTSQQPVETKASSKAVEEKVSSFECVVCKNGSWLFKFCLSVDFYRHRNRANGGMRI